MHLKTEGVYQHGLTLLCLEHMYSHFSDKKKIFIKKRNEIKCRIDINSYIIFQTESTYFFAGSNPRQFGYQSKTAGQVTNCKSISSEWFDTFFLVAVQQKDRISWVSSCKKYFSACLWGACTNSEGPDEAVHTYRLSNAFQDESLYTDISSCEIQQCWSDCEITILLCFLFVGDETLMLAFKAPRQNCSRRHSICFIIFIENMALYFMWIVCLADDSHEISSLVFYKIK